MTYFTMGTASSKSDSDFDQPPFREGDNRESLHLIRERDCRKHDFHEIYQMQNEIGRGGICRVFRIMKYQDRIGGSSKPTLVKRRSLANLIPPSPGKVKKTITSIENSPMVSRPVITKVEGMPPDDLDEYEDITQDGNMYFALKVINLAMVKEDQIEQLETEVSILKRLDHQNIVKAYETFRLTQARKLMIVMELCTGGDLTSRFPYTENQCARITKQLLSAIGFMHDNCVMHRDLKLENVMFETPHSEASIKVIDFGLSKAYSPADHILTERVGTLYCMSPETLQGKYTYTADLWSIGVCIHMLLSGGQKPFGGATPKELIANILRGNFDFDHELWAAVSQKAKDFVSGLLVVDDEQRMTVSEAKKHEWQTESIRESGSFDGPVDEDFKQRIREGIVKYAEFGEFRKLALNVIAKKSSSKDIFELRKVFTEFDTLNTGTLTLEEFREALKQFNYSNEEIEDIFRKVDINRTNVINYTEFLAATLETKGTIEEYRLAEAFDQMDADDSGYISRDNLKQLLGRHCDDDYIDAILSEVECRKPGRIYYDEFLRAISQQNRRVVSSLYDPSDSSNGDTAADEILQRHGIFTNLKKRIKKIPSGGSIRNQHRETSSGSWHSSRNRFASVGSEYESGMSISSDPPAPPDLSRPNRRNRGESIGDNSISSGHKF